MYTNTNEPFDLMEETDEFSFIKEEITGPEAAYFILRFATAPVNYINNDTVSYIFDDLKIQFT